jgi:quercetin dioxygenase-like cupin family protein
MQTLQNTGVIAVRGESLEWWKPATGHRAGPISFKRYGFKTGLPDLNLEFSLTKVGAGYYTPRHRHNYDQIRLVLDGADLSIGNNRVLRVGECGYFPEGCHYGPQDQKEDSYVLTLQCPGASGAYMLSYDELGEAYQMLKARKAEFNNGVYRGKTGEGQTEQKDGYQALWEAQQEKPMTYPKPRYNDIIIMNPENFNWQKSFLFESVMVKALGTFSELETTISLEYWQNSSQTIMPLIPEIRYLLKGTVIYGREKYQAGDCFFIPANSEMPIEANEAEFFVIKLPLLPLWNRLSA